MAKQLLGKEVNEALVANLLSRSEALKAKGVNTLCPDAPQPEWFYDICDALGLYVIEQANINPVAESNNRKVGGTPSNDPTLVGEYFARVKAMYYRTRNCTCIVAYSLGGDKAGNGYNMYKAYEWLKSVEQRRPVFYFGSDAHHEDVLLRSKSNFEEIVTLLNLTEAEKFKVPFKADSLFLR
mgnify:CR=1 FL=1